MRVVIPYRLSGEGLELRFALRSMFKYFAGISGALLIGDRPEWYKGDHIPLADLKGEKERSMQLKVLQAPDEVFLYSNDDYFANQPFNYDLPDYYDTSCRDMAERHTVASYRAMYSACGPDWLNFDIHTPMIFVRRHFIKTFEGMIAQTPIKTTYGQDRKLGQYLCDIKIRGQHTKAELEAQVKGRPFFSTHDSAVNKSLITFLYEKYPVASPWEA